MESKYFRGGYQIRDQNATHYLTFSVYSWIDVFTRKEYKDIVIDSFRYCQQKKGLILYAFVIMSHHIHLLARASEGFMLGDIIRDCKKFTHHQMMLIMNSEKESRRQWMLHHFKYYGNRNARNKNFRIWINDNHPEECFSKAFTDTKINYIHQNLVRAGIVYDAEDYVYSSAANYAGKKGILQVEVIL